MITELIIKNAVSIAMNASLKLAKECGAKLLSSDTEIEESISQHIQAVDSWSQEVNFTDLKKARKINEIFIELETYVYPRRIRLKRDEIIDKTSIFDMFNDDDHHYIILGNPGAGKTTTMKFLCNKMIHSDFFSEKFRFPLLVKLREINPKKTQVVTSSLIEYLYKVLGLRVDFYSSINSDADELSWLKEKLVISVLNELQVLIVLDGFDELVTDELRESVIADIRKMAEKLFLTKLVLTSRTGDFVYIINKTRQFEICPLSEMQIQSFALKWLGNVEDSSSFLSQIKASPFADTSIRPLTLAHLCAIYERVGEIPDKPKDVYKKIIELLLDVWDQQRSVKRVSRYSNFGTSRKSEFLANLSYTLTISTSNPTFSEKDLSSAYTQVCNDFALPVNEVTVVVGELESHTGLFINSGDKEFEFSHKSLQEYLAAYYLVRLPKIPTTQVHLRKLPNELAIAVAISSLPSDYFVELVINRFLKIALSEDFIKSFTSRLVLEKPDFNNNCALTFTLICLYTIYIQSNVIKNDQLCLFIYDNIITEFEGLLSKALQTTGIEFAALLNKYEQIHEFSIENIDDVLIEMHSKSNRTIRYHGFTFPIRIYIRRGLLSIIKERVEEAERNQVVRAESRLESGFLNF